MAGGNAIQAGSFAERWNGTSWHLQSLPGTAGVGAVSCVSVSFCETVGSAGGDMWNGSAWSAQTIPGPPGSTSANLSGVSCLTTTFCEAVGQYNDSSGNTLSLAATWNGTAWTAQPTPNPAISNFTRLSEVSCATATACQAAGEFRLSTANRLLALAESWNGTSWQTQQAASPPGATANSLSAVSCVSATFCEAVGSHSDSDANTVALAERWNGTTWRIQQTPNPAASNGLRMNLAGVSCVSTLFCEGVGSSSSTTGGGAEIWNGTTWALQSVPGGPLTSVSCTSASFCMAAGTDGHVDTWNGTVWSAQPTAAGFTALTSVSCVSPGSCEATGSGPAGDEAEGWNGTSWSAQATPAPSGASSPQLSAVSCAGAQSCEAVGSYFNSSFQQVTLAEAWNGTAWSAQASPNPASATVGSALAGVQCTSAASCIAVGQASTFFGSLTLAEAWNGTSWRLRSTPDHPYAGQNNLNGVSCGVSSVCTAVGVTDDLGQIPATLIETGD